MRAGLILLGLVTWTGCDDGDVTDTDADSGTETVGADLVNGQAVFTANCSECHGSEGTNGSAPDLSQRVPGKTVDDIISLTTTGQGYMPVIDISDEDRSDVAHFAVETWGGS